MSFRNVTPEEYDRLIKNKNRIFDLTFKTPEVLNKYRNDKNIYDEIKYIEKQNKKINNYNKILEDNFNKHLPKKNYNKNEKTLLNVLENLEDTVKQSNDSNDIDIVKNVFKNLSKKKDYINYADLKKLDNENKFNKYKFDNDEDIIKSFETIFKENDIEYKPYSISEFHKIENLLDKLEYDDRIDKNLYNYFYNTLRDKKKLTHKIPIKNILNQDGNGLFKTNKVRINTDLLNKNILSIRYLTGKKLPNKLLKDDYRISKNMVNAIKFNKDIHKLSKNEKNVYYELQKYLNKGQDINVLIGSYLSGNNSKNLFNKINKILYDKYKNNLITQKEYTNLLSKINNV